MVLLFAQMLHAKKKDIYEFCVSKLQNETFFVIQEWRIAEEPWPILLSLSQSVDIFSFHFRLVCRWDKFICKITSGKWNEAFNHIINWQICQFTTDWFHIAEPLFSCVLLLEGTEYISIHLHSYLFSRLNKLSCYFRILMWDMI